MKNKRDIYCDYRFWEEFFEMEYVVLHNHVMRKLWDAFYDFLSNNNLFFNIPAQSVSENTPGGINLNEIRQKKGGAGVKFIPNKFPKLEDLTNDDDNLLNAVFLTMLDSTECEALSAKYGVIVFNTSMIFTANHVFIDNGVSLDETTGQNWNFLYNLKEKCPSISCCNSLIVADRYLLANVSDNVLNVNVKPIFDALLPQTLDNDIVFTICVIAQPMGTSIESKATKLENLVKRLRPNLKFKMNVFNSKKLHDRSILTNNIILTSGAGFDVVGMDELPLKFTTTSLSFPFLQSISCDDSRYLDWINNILKQERECRSFQRNYWGAEDTYHHLLDYYYEAPQIHTASFSLGAAFGDILLKARASS